MTVLNNISSLTRVLVSTAGIFMKPASLARNTGVLQNFHSSRSLHSVTSNVVMCGCHRNNAVADSVANQNGLHCDYLSISIRGYSSRQFQAPSPYKNPGPRRYGYRPNFFAGGLLPRVKTNRRLPMPGYKPRDNWSEKASRRGQNDYIDLLGDGNVHPVNLYKAPAWLVGFRGNEMQRLLRQMSYDGERMKMLYPTKHHNVIKRIKYLYKKYNHKRSNRSC